MRFGIAEGHVGPLRPKTCEASRSFCGRGVRRIAKRQKVAALEKARGWKASVFRRGLEGFQILLTRKSGGRHYRTRPLPCRVSDFFDVEIEGVPL